MDQARALGFDRQMVAQLVAEIVLDEQARTLRLEVSDAEIAKRITADPGFQTPTGQFDRVRFEQTIRQAGYTEQRFVAEQRRRWCGASSRAPSWAARSRPRPRSRP